MRQQKFGQRTQTSAGVETSAQRTQYVKQIIGGRTFYMKPGESVEQFMNNRPTVATSGYWDVLAFKVCAGAGISKLLAQAYSMQGTTVRSTLEVDDKFFRAHSKMLFPHFQDVWEYVTDWGIRNDISISDPPVDWRKTKKRPPCSVNVDIGRNSAALIRELEAGITTFEEVFGEKGEDWEEQLEQGAIESNFINKLRAQYSLSAGQISEIKEAAIQKAIGAPSAQLLLTQ
jgi:hypothetical protein